MIELSREEYEKLPTRDELPFEKHGEWLCKSDDNSEFKNKAVIYRVISKEPTELEMGFNIIIEICKIKDV